MFFWGTNFDIWKIYILFHFIHSLYDEENIKVEKENLSVLYMQCGVFLCFISPKKKIENIKC